MKALHTSKAHYTFAFILGGLFGLMLASPSRGAESFRLDRIAITRFTPASDGRMDIQQGILDVTGNVRWRSSQSVPAIAGIPTWALGRDLVRVDHWLAYYALGSGEGVSNFEIQAGGVRVVINDQAYLAVGLSESARVFTGGLINISTRARVAAGGDVVIGGFVVEDRPRVVLVRAIGPGLNQFNVAGPTPDPYLSVKRDGMTIHFNDNWGSGADFRLIQRAAARVGAFPLEASSRDAAKVVILGPGAYTVEVRTASPDVPGGQVLLEVYSVPEDVFDQN